MFARRDDINLAYCRGQRRRYAARTARLDDGLEGRRRPQLLAREQRRLRRHLDHVDHELGRLDRLDGGSQDRARAARAARSRARARTSRPTSGVLFSTTVYPVLERHCSECHASDTALKQQPFFAEGPPSDADAVELAYEAAKSKMNLDDPAISRFVLRLRNEFHNCWTQSCANDANTMQAAIQQLQQRRDVPTAVDPNLITSKATTLYEGTIASGGNRYEANVIALYEFKTGQDCGTSITGACAIGVRHERRRSRDGPHAVGQRAVVRRLGLELRRRQGAGLDGLEREAQEPDRTTTGEYSIEAWVAPGNVVQEDMRIVSYSASLTNRNFNLGQTMYNYDFFNRTQSDQRQRRPAAVDAGRGRGAASDAAARRRHVPSGRRPQDLRERRARRAARSGAGRHASRAGTTPTRSCSATRCRTTACGTA